MVNDVLDFWFKEVEPANWWKKDPEFDQLIERRFYALHQQASQCELYEWRETPKGRLAEIIVLDQFSRNIFRDSAKAFDCDPLALALSQEAIRVSADKELSPVEKSFLYMPFMHSESRMIHEAAERLYDQPGLENNLAFELKHKQIIDRFGRYPHRNEFLNRKSSEEELAFLKQPGSSF